LSPEGWVVGMAVKKDDVELIELLKNATNELVSSGEMAGIFAKHGVKLVSP
jgi:ABC-type amino acid transport substrate-binding protein